jgi:hypothetical protein
METPQQEIVLAECPPAYGLSALGCLLQLEHGFPLDKVKLIIAATAFPDPHALVDSVVTELVRYKRSYKEKIESIRATANELIGDNKLLQPRIDGTVTGYGTDDDYIGHDCFSDWLAFHPNDPNSPLMALRVEYGDKRRYILSPLPETFENPNNTAVVEYITAHHANSPNR